MIQGNKPFAYRLANVGDNLFIFSGMNKDLDPRKTLIPFVVLFLLSVGVQVLVWQNHIAVTRTALSGITEDYRDDAEVLLRGDVSAFLFGPNPPSDAKVLSHPPGYSILMAAFYGIFGESVDFRAAQIPMAALGAFLVWLIALELFGTTTAWIAAVFVAISPQISYNSIFILPDALAVIPLLASVYFIVLAYKRERAAYAIAAGVLVGVSCWFRANSLLIPLFAAALLFVLLPKGPRLRAAAFLVLAFAAVILPITIRNYVGFHSLIPVSLGSGVNLIAGIGDYDHEGKFGIPWTDEAIMKLEANVLNCPECANAYYSPNGIERERFRVRWALTVISSNPAWFAGVVVRRGLSYFRFERVPVISSLADDAPTADGLLYYLNVPLRFVQKAFITAVFLPVFIVGVFLLLREREDRNKLLILLTIPLYYVCIHSLVHTEYRYVMAIQHFMLIISAVAIVRLIRLTGKHLKTHRLADT